MTSSNSLKGAAVGALIATTVSTIYAVLKGEDAGTLVIQNSIVTTIGGGVGYAIGSNYD